MEKSRVDFMLWSWRMMMMKGDGKDVRNGIGFKGIGSEGYM